MSNHPALYKSITAIIERYVPAFIRNDHPMFIEFMDAYFSWMEETGRTQEILTDFANYRDIDKTVDEFLDYFRKNYFENIPKNILVDKRLLAKHVRDLYVSKGAVPAYKLLFRILFNQNVEIFYPGDDVLRASDGRWVEDRVIRTTSSISGANLDLLDSSTVTGLTSGASATVESKLRTQHSTSGIILQNFTDGYVPTSFSRASSASVVMPNGFIEIIGNNTARIDYDSVTGEKLGLLIEPSRTNMLTNSNEFGNTSSWIHRRVVMFGNITISPLGTQTADKISDTTDNTTHYISQVFPSANGTSYSFSVFVRPEELDMVQLKFTNSHFGDDAFATFDLANGTIHETGISLDRAKIKGYRNGFYRLVITATADTTFTFSQVFIYLFNRATNSISYAGQGNRGIYISCAQLESHGGEESETSYIPTNGAAATRSSEYGSYENDEDFFPTEQGSVYVNVARNVGSINDTTFVTLTDDGDNNIGVGIKDTFINVAHESEGVNTDITLTDLDIGTESLLSIGYAGENLNNSLTANGSGLYALNPYIDVVHNTRKIIFGSPTMNGHIRYFVVYYQRHSQETMNSYTSSSYDISTTTPPIITEFYLSDIKGVFLANEYVEFSNMLSNGSLSFREQVYDLYTGFDIVNPGVNYQVNDEVSVVESSTNTVVARGSVSNIGPNGQIRTISMNNFGIALLTGQYVIVESTTGSNAILTPVTGTLGEFSGRWIGTYGQLSSDKRLQDNLYYQDFSYVLRSSVNVDDFSSIVKELIHPAGFQLFGELFSEEINVKYIHLDALSIAVYRTIESLRSIILRISGENISIEKKIEAILDGDFLSHDTFDNILLFQRANMFIGEYDEETIGTNLNAINEALVPNIEAYNIGILTARPATFFRRNVGMIQTIQ